MSIVRWVSIYDPHMIDKVEEILSKAIIEELGSDYDKSIYCFESIKNADITKFGLWEGALAGKWKIRYAQYTMRANTTGAYKTFNKIIKNTSNELKEEDCKVITFNGNTMVFPKDIPENSIHDLVGRKSQKNQLT
jgi:hypothetical protein